MALTKAQLIQEVLEDLVATGAGQTATAEDTAAVERRFGPACEDLFRRNICDVFDEDDIPAEYFNHLVVIVRNVVAPKFGGADDEAQRLRAEEALRHISRQNQPRRKLKIDRALLPRRCF
jgi:Tfp pilus assembly protein FimV